MSDDITLVERLRTWPRHNRVYPAKTRIELIVEAATEIERQAAEIDLLKRALQLEKEQRAFIQSQYDKLTEWQTRHATECATAKRVV